MMRSGLARWIAARLSGGTGHYKPPGLNQTLPRLSGDRSTWSSAGRPHPRSCRGASSISTDSMVGLRDRALIGVLI